MIRLFTDYPYLWLSSAMLLASIVAISTSRQKRALLTAGWIGMLFGLFSFEFIPWYWDPAVTGKFIASPEDLMFSFATGAIAWYLAGLFSSRELSLDLQPRRLLLRAAGYALPGIAIAYAFGLTVMNHMPLQTTLIGVSVMGLYFLWCRREFALQMVLSSLVFTALYVTLLKAAFSVWPRFILAWNMQIQPAIDIVGLPAFEVFWAIGYGFVFPLYLLMVFDARLQGEPAVSRREVAVSDLER